MTRLIAATPTDPTDRPVLCCSSLPTTSNCWPGKTYCGRPATSRSWPPAISMPVSRQGRLRWATEAAAISASPTSEKTAPPVCSAR